MSFNSFGFLLFFPTVVAVYFAIPHRFRWIFLLAASYYFYMSWKLEYILLIVASTLVDYVAGLRIGRTDDERKRKVWLWFSLVVNLGMLFGFKYFNFFSDSLRLLFDRTNLFYTPPLLNVLLPVGISFYTFQTMSYTIDIYRKRRKPGNAPRDLRALCLILPPTRGWAYRALDASLTAIFEEARVRRAAGGGWIAADGMGSFQKVGHRRPPRDLRQHDL